MPQAEAIVVLGAGAIGSVYAVKLAARHRVTVVARRDHVDAIQSAGLRLIGRETLTAQVDAVTQLQAVAPNSVILLTTKVNASEAALAPIAGSRPRRHRHRLCAERSRQRRRSPVARCGGRGVVLRAITQFGAIFQAPGVVNFTASGYTLLEDETAQRRHRGDVDGGRPRRAACRPISKRKSGGS